MQRRQFLKDIAAGAAAITSAPAVLARKGPNDTIGVACVGVGTRGHQLLQEAQACPNTEIRVICDLYKGNIERAKRLAKNPNVRVVPEWEKAVADKDVDVVLIATPDFWHAPMTVAAAQNKKDIYVEKGWCRTLAEAKAMRKAVKDNNVVLQLGHHYNSLPTFHKAREIYQSGQLGKVPLIRTYIDRTNPYPEWQFYGMYDINKLPADATEENIDWKRFIANAPKRSFDPERFFRWRCWWDYGTGIAGDLLSHLWDSVNMVAGMGIPEAAQTMGNLYFWKEDREVPDIWHVLFDYPKQDLAFTFNCTFNSRHVGEAAQFLGREKALEVGPDFCRTYGGEWKMEYLEKLYPYARRKAAELGVPPQGLVPPEYMMKRDELQVTNHMQNFMDCSRSRETPRCGVGRAFQEAVAIIMSVEAYRKERKVRWDPNREEIV